MGRKFHWKRHLAILLSGGFLLCNTAWAAAAPVTLSLNESIALALRNNPSIKMAESDKEKAAWYIQQENGGKAPSLTLNHADERGKTNPLTGGGVVGDLFSSNVSLSLPLYTGGKAEGNIAAARESYKAADATLERTKQQIVYSATSGYYTVLQDRNLLQVARDSVTQLEAHLKNAQAQYSVGTVAKLDVLQSQVNLANAQDSLMQAQNQYDLAISSLNNVIGLPVDTQVQVKDELQYEKYGQSLAECIQYALANRPDALASEHNLEATRDQVKVAKGGHLPDLSLNAASYWNSTSFPGLSNNYWQLSLNASWNVFDSGVTNSEIKQADAAVVKAEQQLRQTKDTVQLDVRTAYLSMREAEKRIETTKVAVEEANEAYKIAEVRYTAGVGTNLDVMDAEVNLTTAKTNYIKALYDYNTARAQLNEAMGVEVQAPAQ
jgi:TolC family type I secretion outer membrane protein